MKTGLEIGILTTFKNGSSKVLAETLSPFLKANGHNASVFYNVSALTRLFSAKETDTNPLIWLALKAKHFFTDRKLFKNLRDKEAIIVCDFIPYAFYKHSYNIARLKKKLPGKPVLFYAVQYLENAPTLMKRLNDEGHASIDRYDWHLTVSDITEVRNIQRSPWSRIGLNLQSTGLKPVIKEKFLAVVDFKQPGYERYRQEQIEVLEELQVPYIALEKKYTLDEIREIYKLASIYFIQSFEAYGMPIAENLACGAFVFTAENSWPMSWRLNEEVEIHGLGELPECFVVYHDKDGLRKRIKDIREGYDPEKTPLWVFNEFVKNYPQYYYGDEEGLNQALKWIQDFLEKKN